jgi:hypothetical protein
LTSPSLRPVAGMLVAIALVAAGSGGPDPAEMAHAIAVARQEAAGNSATDPVLLGAHRGVLDCVPRPCPEVWTVVFAVTNDSAKPGHATVQIKAATGTLMYSDWSWP